MMLSCSNPYLAEQFGSSAAPCFRSLDAFFLQETPSGVKMNLLDPLKRTVMFVFLMCVAIIITARDDLGLTGWDGLHDSLL